jgi:uncharacterized protein involved in outer membrane biogenesis
MIRSSLRSRYVLMPLGLALALAITLAAAALVVARLPVDGLPGAVAAWASGALGRETQVDGARVRLLPRPVITLTGVRVADDPEVSGTGGANTPWLASADRVHLEPRLLPLLKRQVVVNRVVVDRLASD